jgi:hypothetical protein
MAKRPALDPETARLRKLAAGALADEIGGLEARIDALKAEAIRRDLRRAQGADFRIALSPPGISQRTDKRELLRVMGITADEFAARFCNEVPTGWRLTCTPLRKTETARAA